MRNPLVVLFSLLSFCSHAQKKIASITLSDKIVLALVDRVGELYALTSGGQIQKFDINGNILSSYKREPRPTLFEPRDGSRLFAFFRDKRKIEYLKPSFELYDALIIDSAFVLDPWLACSFGDHNIIVVDAADNALKRINPRTSTVEVDVSLQGIVSKPADIIYMREYQGFIFLLDQQKGIHIVSGMGRLIKTILVPNLPYFNFLGEELYYPINNDLHFLNLLSGEQRDIKLPKAFNFGLITDERLFLIQPNTVDFFEFKP